MTDSNRILERKTVPANASPSLDTYKMIIVAPKKARFADNHAGLRPVEVVKEQPAFLSDRNSRSEERPWRKWRLANARAEAALITWKAQPRFQKWGERIGTCGDYLQFGSCPDGDGKWLTQANFCHVKVCPMCMWRRSKKLTAQVLKVAHTLQTGHSGIQWLMLTLTIQNIQAGFTGQPDDQPEAAAARLAEGLDTLAHGVTRLMKQRPIQRVVIGWYRTIEITRNLDEDAWRTKSQWYGSYHPHIHILLAVGSDYRKSGYITQAHWTDAWQQAAQLDYKPIVHITKLKAKRSNGPAQTQAPAPDPLSAVVEVTKYLTKPSFLAPDKADFVAEQTLRTIAKAVVGRRLTGWGGIMKAIKADLQLEDAEADNADLTHTADEETVTQDCKCPVCKSNLIQEVYFWHMGHKQYVKN